MLQTCDKVVTLQGCHVTSIDNLVTRLCKVVAVCLQFHIQSGRMVVVGLWQGCDNHVMALLQPCHRVVAILSTWL